MVYFMENPHLKWMMPGGSPILGTPQVGVAMAVMAIKCYGSHGPYWPCGWMVWHKWHMAIWHTASYLEIHGAFFKNWIWSTSITIKNWMFHYINTWRWWLIQWIKYPVSIWNVNLFKRQIMYIGDFPLPCLTNSSEIEAIPIPMVNHKLVD